ncbi:hypothetical protein MRX96_058745 [Rhipicephalus microplus]
MYRPSQTPRLTLSSKQVAQAQPAPRRETEGPSLGARSVDNTLVRFPLHRMGHNVFDRPATLLVEAWVWDPRWGSVPVINQQPRLLMKFGSGIYW